MAGFNNPTDPAKLNAKPNKLTLRKPPRPAPPAAGVPAVGRPRTSLRRRRSSTASSLDAALPAGTLLKVVVK